MGSAPREGELVPLDGDTVELDGSFDRFDADPFGDGFIGLSDNTNLPTLGAASEDSALSGSSSGCSIPQTHSNKRDPLLLILVLLAAVIRSRKLAKLKVHSPR